MRFLFTIIIIAMSSQLCMSQVPQDYVVRLNAKADPSVPSITITWPVTQGATNYTIYKKNKDDDSWGSYIGVVSGTDSMYTDYDVAVDSAYEYKIRRYLGNGGGGFIYAGIKLPAREKRGTIILMVDSLFTNSISAEIHRLMDDLSGDGWAVIRHDVSRNMAVPAVKAMITSDYYADSINVRALFLLGHIPVPYSGDINPDGHWDHRGAWPADCYYADIDGIYTDVSVADQVAASTRNWNIPGDGKFDNDVMPSSAELMIGRVDFNDMPAFNTSEINLMKRYLDKDHAFRMSDIKVSDGGLIDDNFGLLLGNPYAANAWEDFPPLVGDSSVHEGDFFTILQSQQHLWSYGCGYGWFQGVDGVGSTTDFVNDSVQTVFTIFFGSWFGDWDSQDNFLRAPLASRGLPLTSCWGYRPWYFHHMAMGEPIGYSVKWAMQNSDPYSGGGPHLISVALMGDPSLRLSYVAPPQQVVANVTSPVEITWNSSSDIVDGYYVYRSASEFGVYERISPYLVQGNIFYDSNPLIGFNYYMVRAVALYIGPSGSYYNISTGIKTMIHTVSIEENTQPIVSVYPNPTTDYIFIKIPSKIKDGRILLYSIHGELLLKETIQEEETMIDISDYAKGVYIMKVVGEDKSLVKKIIKQ